MGLVSDVWMKRHSQQMQLQNNWHQVNRYAAVKSRSDQSVFKSSQSGQAARAHVHALQTHERKMLTLCVIWVKLAEHQL